jgi:hypothetical protein
MKNYYLNDEEKKELRELTLLVKRELEDSLKDFEEKISVAKSTFYKVNLVNDFVRKHIKKMPEYYWPLGFTPRLSGESSGVNCFGYTQILAYFLKKAGLDFKMAIGGNHEFCLIQDQESKYLLSIYGLQKMPDFKLSEGVQVYRKDEENPGQLHDVPESLFVICDFHQGTLYQYLENFRFYGEYANGNTVFSTLSANEEDMDAFKKAIGVGLGKVNWEKYQKKYCPQIYKVFREIKSEVVKENDNLQKHYESVRADVLLSKIFKEIFIPNYRKSLDELNRLQRKNLYKQEAEICRDAMIFYGDEFLKHFEAGTVDRNWPMYFKNFVFKVREKIYKIEDEKIRQEVIKRLISPIMRLKEEEKLSNKAMKSVEESLKRLKKYIDQKR